MILIIDNYDSFTYNLVQYISEWSNDIKVFRNDKITLQEIDNLHPDFIVISPGPGGPEQAGISMSVIQNFANKIPILGVCLGHQCIAKVFGAKVTHAKKLMHGKTSDIYHDKKTIYKSLPNPFKATRYHSLIVDNKTLPDILEITAWTQDGEIMGLRHKRFTIEGVQFHPESILTSEGKKLLKNFFNLKPLKR